MNFPRGNGVVIPARYPYLAVPGCHKSGYSDSRVAGPSCGNIFTRILPTVMHRDICLCMYARTHARTHTRTHTRTHARTHARTHTRTHARTHTHTHTHTHTYTHTHTHTHTRTHTPHARARPFILYTKHVSDVAPKLPTLRACSYVFILGT